AEVGQLRVLGGNPDQTPFPRAEQYGRSHRCVVNEIGHMRTERLEVKQQTYANQPEDYADYRAYEPIAHQVQGLEIVAATDMLGLQPGLIPADDVQEEFINTKGLHVIGNAMSAVQRGSQIIEAFHDFPFRGCPGDPGARVALRSLLELYSMSI